MPQRATSGSFKPKSFVAENGRECLTCGQFKPWGEYYAGQGCRGRRGECRACKKLRDRQYYENNRDVIRQKATEYHRRTKHIGITRPKPDRCEVCGDEVPLIYEHDHKTKLFRGWACRDCNWALGHAHDSIDRLKKLIAYLKRARLNGAPI